MEFTEQEIKALAKGDHSAFQKLYHNFFVPLCVFAENFDLEPQEAEDVVQEVFCKIYHEPRLLDGLFTLKPYLYSAVRNRCLNYLRNEKRRRNREEQFVKQLEDERFFCDQIIEGEVYRQLKQLLEELPPQCRNIFQRSLNGDTSEKIASELNLSVETVKTQRKKAKRILRERYSLLFSLFGVFFGMLDF